MNALTLGFGIIIGIVIAYINPVIEVKEVEVDKCTAEYERYINLDTAGRSKDDFEDKTGCIYLYQKKKSLMENF